MKGYDIFIQEKLLKFKNKVKNSLNNKKKKLILLNEEILGYKTNLNYILHICLRVAIKKQLYEQIQKDFYSNYSNL